MTEIDAVRLHFTPESLIALDVVLAFVLFGVALDSARPTPTSSRRSRRL
jgi:hypothetical protein